MSTGTGTNFSPNIDIADFIKTCYKSMGVLLLIILLFVVLYYAKKDPLAVTKNAYKFIFPIFIPLLLLFGYYIQQNTGTSIVGLIVASIIALVAIYIQTTMSKTAMTGANIFLKYLLLPIICMVALAIAYKPLSEYTYGLTGWSKFIMELIFYIPCLILDFFEYLKGQYKITPNIVYILFVIEILLILLYIYIPKLLKLKLKSKGKTLLEKPVFLNKEKIIGRTIAETIILENRKIISKGEIIKSTTTDELGWFIFTNLPQNDEYLFSLEESDTHVIGKKSYAEFKDSSGKLLKSKQIGSKYVLANANTSVKFKINPKNAIIVSTNNENTVPKDVPHEQLASVNKLNFGMYFKYNVTQIDVNDGPFKQYIDNLAELAAKNGSININLTSCASQVPTRAYKTNTG
jgi:hypothetical protein